MSAKPFQVLQIDPPTELVFKGPFTDVVTSYLELSNPSDKQVCFKVKTTAPKQYCVRPNSGLIPAKGNVKVAVMLQPFDYNAEEKTSKHKFMVQTTFVPEGESSLDNIWKNTSSSELMDSKLRVVFEMPESNSTETDTSKISTPQKQFQVANNLEAELRKTVDDKKKLQSSVDSLEVENAELRERLKRAESNQMGMGGSLDSSVSQGNDFKLLHIILAAVLALVLGLLFGKVF